MHCGAFVLVCCLVILVPVGSGDTLNSNGLQVQSDFVSHIGDSEPVLEHIKHFRTKRSLPRGPEFRLFTRENRGVDDYHVLVRNDTESVDNSTLDPSLPTTVVVHGFWEGAWKPWMHEIKDKRLDMEPCNVILVDWQDLASATLLPYIGPTVNTQRVGDDLADLLNFLRVYKGLSIPNTHIIGFSLGAHVSGIAGYHLRHSHDSRVGRITGLDPAGPVFAEGFITKLYTKLVNVHERRRLDSSDADFVDVIRTSEGTYGSSIELGHIDFLMNGGSNQPGCRKRDAIKACHHARAHQFFIESMTAEPSYAFMYKDYEKYKSNSCPSLTKNVIGYHVEREPIGVFYAKTEDHAPFLATSTMFISLHITGDESVNDDIGYIKIKIWAESPWTKMFRCEPDNTSSEFTTVVTIPSWKNESDSHQIEVCFSKNLEGQLAQVKLQAIGNLGYSLEEEIEPTICPVVLDEILPIWAWILIAFVIVIVIIKLAVIIIFYRDIRKHCCHDANDPDCCDDTNDPYQVEEKVEFSKLQEKEDNQDSPSKVQEKVGAPDEITILDPVTKT